MLFSPPKPTSFRILTHLEHSSGYFEEVWGWKRGRGARWERIAGTSLEVLIDMWTSFLSVCEQPVPQQTHSCLDLHWYSKTKFGQWAMTWWSDMIPLQGIIQAKRSSFERTLKFLATGQDLSSHDWIFSSKMSLITEMADGFFRVPTWSTGLKARSETHVKKLGITFKLRSGKFQRKVIYL